MVRIDLTGLHEVLDFGNRHSGGGRHDGVEVSSRPAIHEISGVVARPGVDEGEVGVHWPFEHVGSAVEGSSLLAFGGHRAVPRRREETANACSCCPDALGERALRNQLDLDLAGKALALKFLVLADVAGNHLADLPRSKEDAEAEIVNAGIVADNRQIARAPSMQRMNQIL